MPPSTMGPTRRARNSKAVTAPKSPPPPRSAQNRSGCSSADARTMRPSARTTSAASSESIVRPWPRISQPRPPPSVRPPTPVCEIWPAGTARPCSWVAASTSPSRAPPPTRTSAVDGIDGDAPERPQIDAERTVADGSPGDGVASGADRERQLRGLGGADRGGDVVGVAGVGDRGRTPLDRAVPGGASLVVVGVGRLDETTDESARAQGAGERGSGGDGCRVHAAHDPAVAAAAPRAFPLTATPIFARRTIGKAPPERGFPLAGR